MTDASVPGVMYPIIVKLDGRPVLVVGGGRVAARKIGELLSCGARVTLVSPTIDDRIRPWIDRGDIRWRAREFRADDVRDVDLVVAATPHQAVNASVVDAAHVCRLLVNAVDQPDLCDFYLPSVRRRGPLIIAVSTSGISPALASRLADDIVAGLTAGMETYLELLDEARREIKARYPDDSPLRHRLAAALLDCGARQLVEAGDVDSARAALHACVEGTGADR
jgi:precorrin-2 dehydrogenase/sirohydrochlorin ferrochelatase